MNVKNTWSKTPLSIQSSNIQVNFNRTVNMHNIEIENLTTKNLSSQYRIWGTSSLEAMVESIRLYSLTALGLFPGYQKSLEKTRINKN